MQLDNRHNYPSMRIDGQKLRTLREGKFLTLDELADEAHVHRDSLGRIERGAWKGGSRIPTIRRIAEALDVPPSELIEDHRPSAPA
jgi:transcriptional regulator with XRE-family HTH domain